MNRLYHKMLQVIDKFMSNRYIPTWVIASIDAAIVILSVFISGFLIDIKEQWFNFPFDNYSIRFIVLTVCCTILSLHLFKIHRSVIRYSSFSDMMRILLAISSTAVLILIGNFLYKLNYDKDYIPKELILVNACVCFIGLFMFRMFVRQYRAKYPSDNLWSRKNRYCNCQHTRKCLKKILYKGFHR